MTRARDIANLVDANGDIVAGALDNVPAADLVNDTTPQLGGNLETNGNNINFGDTDKAIFGAGSDLQVFHDATDSHVVTTNGNLNLEVAGGGTVNVGDQFGNYLVKVNDNLDVKLFYGQTPSEKLATTSTGVSVTGDVSATGSFIGSGGLVSQQVFTSSGTWTKPSGVSKVKVYVTGAGGGGGYYQATDDFGGSGGAGGTAILIVDVSAVSSVSVTVGGGGAGGSSGSPDGSTGGSSSFGAYCSATGGGGGNNGNGGAVYGGVGGNGSGGDINITGGNGDNGWDNFNVSNTYASSLSTGGASYWGGGGRGSVYTNMAANNGQAYGSGGGSSHSRQGGTAGAGRNGVVVIEEYA